MVGGDAAPWLVDFDQAAAAAGPRLLQRDTATLVANLTRLVGPDRARAPAGAVPGTGAPGPSEPQPSPSAATP
jgi:hypothetical protein